MVAKLTTLYISLTIILFFSTKSVQAQCHIDDWTALKALYESTDGNLWKNNTGWKQVSDYDSPPDNCDLEQLHGVELDSIGRVFFIGLSDNDLFGSIPPEIGKLKHLKILSLSQNFLTGNIPKEIGELTKLERVTLYLNELEGPIPSEIGNLVKLQWLWLSINKLTENIPKEIGNLNYLERLWLSDNQLNGNIPGEIGNLANLQSLWLQGNQLTGCIPAELGKLSNLIYLDLSSNLLSCNIPDELGNLSNLDRMCLENNQLEESIPESLFNLSAEIKLDFDIEANKCHIDDWTGLGALYNYTDGENWEENENWDELFSSSEPPNSCDLEDLHGVTLGLDGRVRLLWLDSNNLKGVLPEEIGKLDKLIELRLNCNMLTGSLPTTLSNLKRIKKLDLSSNPFSKTFPIVLTEISSLEGLDLGGTYLKGNIPSSINKLKNLTDLRLDRNQLDGNIPPELGDLNNLEYLYLGYNNLSGTIPIELGKLENLWHLELRSNQLSGIIPKELSKLNSLYWLFLSDNELSGSIPKELGDMDGINVLLISYNQLSGAIPKELGKANSLRSLSLWNNQLSGEIPIELSNLEHLENLNLSQNELTGNIPVGFGSLTDLEELNLSENQLTGIIPSGLGNLGKLNELHLNNNSLNGIVPKLPTTMETVNLQYNNFNCGDMEEHFDNNNRIEEFRYEPQKQLSAKIDSSVYVIEDPNTPDSIALKIEGLPANSSFRWQRNNFRILGEKSDTLIIDNVQPTNAGVYTIEVTENCMISLRSETEPSYVIFKGYDFYGKPVEYNQIMVEFEDALKTEKYEREILYPNAGTIKYECNCQRELYLWEFLNTKDALNALLEIDKKLHTIRKKTKANGGFNNSIKISEGSLKGMAYHVPIHSINNNDEVSIFILDSGLDELNKLFLDHQAPLDTCYNVNQSAGYNYSDTTTLMTNEYTDDLWHGTFGYHAITNGMDTSNSKLKTIPLKVFDKNGKGNLFKITCAIYHAIDHNADIINISAGYQGEASNILEKAMVAAQEKGIFICTAAGNEAQNNDTIPQYPAYYAGKYHYYENIDTNGNNYLDSLKLDNIISVAAIDSLNELCDFSNFGANSVTLSAYGENIYSYGLMGSDVVASGTSMATYFVSRELAMEISADKTLSSQAIWNNFAKNRLIINPKTMESTSTGMRLDVEICKADIKGCTDEEACNYFPFATEDDDSCNEDCYNCDFSYFESYEWFNSDESCRSAIVYEDVLNSYIYIIDDAIGTLYNEDGINYCNDIGDYSCVNNRGLTTISCRYDCMVYIDMNEKLSFNVYPNPAKDKVFVQLDKRITGNYQLSIIDLTGKLMQSVSINTLTKAMALNVKNYPNGVYFIKVKSEQGFYIRKLILK